MLSDTEMDECDSEVERITQVFQVLNYNLQIIFSTAEEHTKHGDDYQQYSEFAYLYIFIIGIYISTHSNQSFG